MRAIATRPLLAVVCLCGGIVIAGAQAPAATPDAVPGPYLAQGAQPPPNASDSNQNAVPQQQRRSGSGAAPGSLSRELSRSGGVIHPPPTGDQSVVPPPNQGTSRTPVIPPPGTPGGNPTIKPK